ncbi:hypothetical protein [Francisella sp. SYW-9]|uniref:hypothetical protein n=1 Tax=Francisella sp. SYW-9 TaxID=2610888 RepID=UPI00123D1BA0|nr:hypothetical protein [Francisella sp. SYW-9]
MREAQVIQLNTNLNQLYYTDDYISINEKLNAKEATFIIGDLHGNASKFISFLFYSEIILAKEERSKGYKTSL